MHNIKDGLKLARLTGPIHLYDKTRHLNHIPTLHSTRWTSDLIYRNVYMQLLDIVEHICHYNVYFMVIQLAICILKTECTYYKQLQASQNSIYMISTNRDAFVQ